MARVARSVTEVIAGEAGGKTRAARYNDMRHIASVIANRAAQLGVSPEAVVQRQSEFNAYGKRMPGGTAALIGLAEDALRDVATAGPVTDATFYATPAAKGNLPKGLQRSTKTASHVYFTDPQNRAIYTAEGLKKPTVTGRAQLGKPLDSYDTARLPTPTPRDVTLASTMPARPASPTPAGAMSPRQEASLASRLGGLLGVSPAAAAERSPGLGYTSQPASRAPNPGLTQAALGMMAATPTTTGNERARSAPMRQATARTPTPAGPPSTRTPSERIGSIHSSTPVPSASGKTSRIGAPTAMGPTQSFNTTQRMDAGNLGTAAVPMGGFTGALSANGYGRAPAAMTPAKAANVSSRIDGGILGTAATTGGLLGSTMPNSGGLLSQASLSMMNAPAVNGISGNERARGLYSQAQMLDADVADQRRAAVPGFQRSAIPSVTAPASVAPALAAAPDLGALPTAFNPALQNAPAYRAPAVVTAPKTARLTRPVAPLAALPRPVTVTPPPKVAAVPAIQPVQRAPIARAAVPTSSLALGYASAPNLSPGLGLPSIPSAPAPTGLLGGMFGAGNGAFSNRRNGAIVGGLLGSAIAGPVGGLLGAVLGRAAGNSSYGTPSNSAQAALDAGWDGFSGMTSTQASAARNAPSGGGSSGWGGGGILGGLGGLLGGLFGGGTTTSSKSSGKGTTGKTGDGGWGRSPNTSGNGGVSANGRY